MEQNNNKALVPVSNRPLVVFYRILDKIKALLKPAVKIGTALTQELVDLIRKEFIMVREKVKEKIGHDKDRSKEVSRIGDHEVEVPVENGNRMSTKDILAAVRAQKRKEEKNNEEIDK